MFNISVVIPAYNEAPRIERSIKSVLNQTHPVKEIVVVDDGSTDDTSKVVAKYIESVRCIQQTNQGLASARNTGIRKAKGEWIAFLDADDEWLPGHIENACKMLYQYPEIVWFCAAFELRSEGGKIIPTTQMNNKFLNDGIIDNYFVAQAETNFSLPSSMLVKKTVLVEAGMFNIEISQHGEDLDMWFRIALRYPKIGNSRSVGCIYWRREGSITTREKKVDIPRFLKRIEITRASSKEIHGIIKDESDYLVQAWVVDAIKCAIRQKDKQSLALIREKFNDLLPPRWKLIRWLFHNSISLEIAQIALAIRALGNK